jgi:hypothetical protein
LGVELGEEGAGDKGSGGAALGGGGCAAEEEGDATHDEVLEELGVGFEGVGEGV